MSKESKDYSLKCSRCNQTVKVGDGVALDYGWSLESPLIIDLDCYREQKIEREIQVMVLPDVPPIPAPLGYNSFFLRDDSRWENDFTQESKVLCHFVTFDQLESTIYN